MMETVKMCDMSIQIAAKVFEMLNEGNDKARKKFRYIRGMIDTVKIYTEIDKRTYDKIKSMAVVKNSIDNHKKQIIDESLYLSGTTTTLKIYNKLLELKKHDMKKFVDNKNFNLIEYINKIKGFIRFECEIKKKILKKLDNNEKHIKVVNVKYEELKGVWSDEFMKILQLIKNDLEMEEEYKTKYKFKYLLQKYKRFKTSKIDFSQSYKVEEMELFYFNPFQYKEVV